MAKTDGAAFLRQEEKPVCIGGSLSSAACRASRAVPNVQHEYGSLFFGDTKENPIDARLTPIKELPYIPLRFAFRSDGAASRRSAQTFHRPFQPVEPARCCIRLISVNRD